ncbi:MAG: transglycosylase domain-containing protein, partial [Chloroflexi bacterium]|nr:transglycosylase domain-containing protein [Chloroflexota bacterium]
VQRKIKETVIALELKRKYSDDQILEWYLNQVYYGNFAYGAEAAAERYFGKHANELTLAEAAMLAGVPQAPAHYTPVLAGNQAAAKVRQGEVLDLMLKHSKEIEEIPWVKAAGIQVTPEMVEAARGEELHILQPNFEINAPHFVFYVQDQVTRMCEKGLFSPPADIPCDKVVYQGGLRIVTSLDMGLQGIGEQTVEDVIGANEERYLGHDGALVAMRPGTGEVLAYVGSRDYFREDIQGQVDIATSLKSHGSTMKVFTYLTAFEKGWVPSTIVRDEPLELDVGSYKRAINNWNYSHLGNITIRKALSESVNVAAVNTVMEVGIDEMRSMAHRLGITDLTRNDCGPTITLGSCEVKLLDMAFAYSTVANNGVMKGRPTVEDLPDGFRQLDPVSILKIEDAGGNLIYQYSAPEEKKVVDPAYAYMITDILSNNAIQWSRLTIDRPGASKTGTSEDFRDNVVMGYTPDLTVGVWMGNADNTPMASGTFSSAGTGPMWKRFMQEALDYLGVPPRPFDKPDDVVTAECGGRQEVFVKDAKPTKPGACRAPNLSGSPTPSPSVPKFPPRAVSPTPTATPSPSPSPSPTGEPSATPRELLYTVQEDDTLTSIADQFGVKLKDLLKANDLTEDSVIQPGDVLKIPARAQADDQSGPGTGGR